jgi:hypothetical protein
MGDINLRRTDFGNGRRFESARNSLEYWTDDIINADNPKIRLELRRDALDSVFREYCELFEKYSGFIDRIDYVKTCELYRKTTSFAKNE